MSGNSRNVKVEAVAIDMSPIYIEAVRDNLKDAIIVFDHFHVSKMFNEKIAAVGACSGNQPTIGYNLLYERKLRVL